MNRPDDLGGQKYAFEDFQILNPEGRKKLKEKYIENKVEKEIDIQWRKINYNRISLLNYIANHIGPKCQYLEVGCDANALFDALPLRHKVGVDPMRGGNRRMTSDAFFEQNTTQFDLIFLDGLHTYDQLHRDLRNALAVLNPGGFICLHDMIPLNWLQEHVPRINGAWTGDVWKVGVEISRSKGLDTCIALIDHGVGLVRGGGAPEDLLDLSDELTNSRFDTFLELYHTLQVNDWQATLDWVASDRAKE